MDLRNILVILYFAFINKFTICLQSFPILTDDDDYCITSDHRPGRCIELVECAPTHDLLIKAGRPIPAHIRQKLNEDNCGYNNRMPKVCCPHVAANGTYPNPSPLEPPPNVSAHRNYKLLPENCGMATVNRVFGGEKTGLFEHPWMALISYYNNGKSSYGCAGTIISMDYILTAAHCLTNLNQGMTIAGVRVGEYNQDTEEDCEISSNNTLHCAPHVQDIRIQESFVHASFNKNTRQNDIGLIRLKDSIDASTRNVQPICLPILPNLANKNLTGNIMTIAGWGLTENNLTSNELRAANVPVINNTRCSAIYKRSSIKIFHKQICAGGEAGVDSCNGDSGGPLMMVDNISSTFAYIQYGIISVGLKKCGNLGTPAVYTRIAYYMDWILDKMRQATEDDYDD